MEILRLPIRYTTAFIITRPNGTILLRKRPSHGLLGGMMEVPTTPWTDHPFSPQGQRVRHTFTHFHLEVDVCRHDNISAFEGIWVALQELKDHALPTLMKKGLRCLGERI